MSFIKFKEEKIWKEWKDKEEAILRRHKIDEAVIQELYEYDWNDFKRRRSFGEHQSVSDKMIQLYGISTDIYIVTSVDGLMDQLNDVNLYNLLKQLDPLTREIVFLKYQGYSSKEISEELNITVRSIDCKLYQLRKKYKKGEIF